MPTKATADPVVLHFLIEEMKVKAREVADQYENDRLTVEINLDKKLKVVKLKVIEHDL
jgi:hypothetical protein